VDIKPLPSNLQAERAYISACLIGGVGAYNKAPLQPTDFYRESFRHIVVAIKKTIDENLPIDATTVAESLKKAGTLESVGGYTLLSSLLDDLPTSANIKAYAKQVKEYAQRREAIKTLETAAAALYKPEGIASTIISQVEDNIEIIKKQQSIKPGRVDISHIYDVDDMISSYENHIENLKQNTLKTGITHIDNEIRGVAPGEVLTIIARAGSFKTALLQNLLLNHAKTSDSIAAFFSLEMPVPMVFERYQQMVNSYTGRKVEKIYSEEDTTISSTLIREKLKNLVVIPVKVSLANIARYIPLIQRKTGRDVSVIGIDYMGLVDGKGEGEYDRISKVATDTKDMAKELNLPVIMISQTNRKGGTGEQRIQIDQGRGSGAIEEGADFILGMWQQTVNDNTEVICSILKNRKGKKGTDWRLEVEPQFMRFSGESEIYKQPKTATYV
jgi:replicative DNA helicase